MSVWRTFIFGLSIALLTAISSPARAADNSLHIQNEIHSHLYQISQSDFVLSAHNNSLFELDSQKLAREKGKENDKEKSKEKDNFKPKTPPYHVKYNRDLRWTPFEREGSSFSSAVQSEPIYVLAYEFHPEILGLKHFLAPLQISAVTPWFLRADAASSSSRLTGWKDGNTLYTGTITYLS